MSFSNKYHKVGVLYSHVGTCQSCTDRSCTQFNWLLLFTLVSILRKDPYMFSSLGGAEQYLQPVRLWPKTFIQKIQPRAAAFYNMPKHTVYSSTRDPSHPTAQQQTFFLIHSQKHKGKPSTRACSSWHHTASLDNRSGVTRDPRRTGRSGRQWSTQGEALRRPTGQSVPPELSVTCCSPASQQPHQTPASRHGMLHQINSSGTTSVVEGK